MSRRMPYALVGCRRLYTLNVAVRTQPTEQTQLMAPQQPTASSHRARQVIGLRRPSSQSFLTRTPSLPPVPTRLTLPPTLPTLLPHTDPHTHLRSSSSSFLDVALPVMPQAAVLPRGPPSTAAPIWPLGLAVGRYTRLDRGSMTYWWPMYTSGSSGTRCSSRI